jgi:hypothetical protein
MDAGSLGLATLASWLVTAAIGSFMLHTWLARGGLRRQRATGAGVPPVVVFGHASTALAGLAIWVGYLLTGVTALAWLDVGVVAAAITLGICMVTTWTPYPVREVPAPPQESVQEEPADTVTDEMIAALLSDSAYGRGYAGGFGRGFGPGFGRGFGQRRRRRKLQLAPLIPVGHGFAAIATFLLATLTATRGR